jgi:hypothetical protein
MKKLVDWIIFSFLVLMFGVSLAVLRHGAGISFASPWFGLLMMFSFLGAIGFARDRALFLLRLPSWFRPLYPWEIRGRFYRTLRVPTFGVLLRRTSLRSLQPLVYFNRTKDYGALLAQIEGAEAAHLWAAALVTPYMIHACVQSRWTVFLWVLAVQTIGNLYPIWHLRWVRCRLGFVLDKRRRVAPNMLMHWTPR